MNHRAARGLLTTFHHSLVDELDETSMDLPRLRTRCIEHDAQRPVLFLLPSCQPSRARWSCEFVSETSVNDVHEKNIWGNHMWWLLGQYWLTDRRAYQSFTTSTNPLTVLYSVPFFETHPLFPSTLRIHPSSHYPMTKILSRSQLPCLSRWAITVSVLYSLTSWKILATRGECCTALGIFFVCLLFSLSIRWESGSWLGIEFLGRSRATSTTGDGLI